MADTRKLLIEAEKHRLFDYDFFQKHQLKTYTSKEEAFEDCLRLSTFSSSQSSADFSPWQYYRQNLDAYHKGVSPIEDCLAKLAVASDMPATFRPPHFIPTTDRLTVPEEPNVPELPVGIFLHVFYQDGFDRFADVLRRFPLPFDLYISIGGEIDSSGFANSLAGSQMGKLTVKEVPNRGRNFGPLLVEFGDDLLNYELVCHLHSKKSLFSGREQHQWADYLTEYLIGDPDLVTSVVNLFASKPELGLYFPETFWMLPTWVNHWLKNKPLDWIGENCPDNREDGFLPYPVGGMFWARSRAIAPLIEKYRSYDQIPEEPIPNDGTMLHSIERSITPLVESRGYQLFFYHPESGVFSQNETFVNLHYFHYGKGEFLSDLRTADSISFDLFDTLVVRNNYFPDFAKYCLGEKLAKLGVVESPEAFVTLRNAAEGRVRQLKSEGGDVSIVEVYQWIIDEYGWNATAADLSEAEFLHDYEQLSPRESIVNAFLDAKSSEETEVMVITDTYYTYEQIVRILKKIGLGCDFQLFVSTDTGMRKDNGTMWRHLKSKNDFGEAHIHVGDNVVSDCQIPGDFGFQTIHLLNPFDQWRMNQMPAVDSSAMPDPGEVKKWGRMIASVGSNPFPL